MADKRITDLTLLAGGDLAAGDLLLAVDVSASDNKKLTVKDLVQSGSALVDDDSIPSAKINYTSQTIPGTALENGAVAATQLAADAVTAAKLADSSSAVVSSALPGSGDYTGQLHIDSDDDKASYWDGSAWVDLKAKGSVNTVTGDTSGIVNVAATASNDSITLAVTLDNTSLPAQFLAGPVDAAGAATYRVIDPDDLPTATSTDKGAVIVNGEGLRMDTGVIEVDNDVAASTSTYRVVTHNAKGLITGSRSIVSGDLPVAESGVPGAVSPAADLTVDGAGVLTHTNSVTAGTYTKLTVDAQGHATAGTTLTDADVPSLPASKITSGTLSVALLATNSITGSKLANASTVLFGGAGSTAGVVTFPTAEFKGQYFWDELNGDLYIWSGSAWLPVTITSGELIYAGTYDASTNQVASTTSAGSAVGLTVGAALPAASTTNNRYYLVVSESGTGSGNAPAEALAPPDMILSNGATWDLIDVSNAIAGQSATNISFTPYGDVAATNVQLAIQELDDEKLPKAGGTVTGELVIGTAGALVFEGSTDDAYETYLAVVDPTADRTITFPDASGTVILAGAASIVNADISASAAIAFSKLASMTSAHILLGNASNVPTATAVTGDVTISNTGVTTVVSASTSVAGKVQLSDSTSSTSTTLAATANAVKTAYDLANGKPGLDTAQTWTKGQRGEITALTDGATITPDFADSNNFSVTLGGSRTLANPTNLTAGQSGCIWITQDGTGSRTLAYGSYWDFTGGTAPTLTTTASAVDCLVYAVQSSTKITATLITNLS